MHSLTYIDLEGKLKEKIIELARKEKRSLKGQVNWLLEYAIERIEKEDAQNKHWLPEKKEIEKWKLK